jgi:Ser/Thr protein kinase RdoA (MazF antagonist)
MTNSPEFLTQLAPIVEADATSFTFIRKSQNRVYEFQDRTGTAKILRITENSHRRREEIANEIEWLQDLHSAGLDVCPPLPLLDGAYLHSLAHPDGESHLTIFAKAPGASPARTDLGENLYFLHGRSLGQLHARSEMAPKHFLSNRRRWDEERYFQEDIENFIPEDVRPAVRDVWHQLRSEFTALPLEPNEFGPAHMDLGYSNFHRDGDRLWLYDFDNCALAPYACDIAVALYGGLFTILRCEFPGDRAAFAHPRTSQNLAAMLPSFREGYESVRPWGSHWMEQLPLWFEFSYFRSVVHAFRMQHPVTNPQAKAALDADIENLLRRQPPIRFDQAETRP